jgi:hypothetical protein
MTSVQAALAAYLALTYPNLSASDIIKFVASGLTVGQIDNYLSHLCGGLSGIAQLIIDSYSGDANAQNLLYQLTEKGNAAKKGDVGAQRVMGLLNIFGVDSVEDVEVPIPDPANLGASPGQLPRADIVLKDGTAIEVGGPSKGKSGGDDLANEIKALVRAYGVDKVEVYLENTGSSASRRAKNRAIEELTDALGGDRDQAERQVTTFKAGDRLCV